MLQQPTLINMCGLNINFQPNINHETPTLKRDNFINVVWTLFCQYWINVYKCTPAKILFSTNYQCWNNVYERLQSMLFQRWFHVDVFAVKLLDQCLVLARGNLSLRESFTDCLWLYGFSNNLCNSSINLLWLAKFF